MASKMPPSFRPLAMLHKLAALEFAYRADLPCWAVEDTMENRGAFLAGLWIRGEANLDVPWFTGKPQRLNASQEGSP